jgi:predicted nucleotide-binding protein
LKAEEVERAIWERPEAKAIILDVMMPPGDLSPLETKAGFETGLSLAEKIKGQHPDLVVLFYTAYSPEGFLKEFGKRRFRVYNKAELSVREIAREVRLAIDGKNRKPKCFIVHGHNDSLTADLKKYLQEGLGFPDPVILRDEPYRGRTIIEAFEESAQLADLVFILLTPDDIGGSAAELDKQKLRARQNVIFEMGYFFGAMQRKRGRVILLLQGACELPSDISGMIPIDITKGIESAHEKIREDVTAAFD